MRPTSLRGVWLLFLILAFVGGGIGDAHPMDGHTALLRLGLGAVAGVLRQLLNRRDVADRLTFCSRAASSWGHCS
ncbi:hypothetical protein GCM10012276_18610 [Nocardioides deserti]|nr:hypothetical protein GCM10012276_18610 [Nocardioides deserti]